jgi:hypothetical protein
MSMQVAPPGGDVTVQVGNAVDNRHGIHSGRHGPFHQSSKFQVLKKTAGAY